MKNSKKKNIRKVSLVLFFFATLIASWFVLTSSNSFSHIYHLISPPHDLYSPIATGDFDFSQINYSQEFTLKPKYRDTYSISIMASPNIIPTGWNKEEEEYQFTGELKAEFFQGSKKIKEIIITDFGFAGFQDNLMTYYSSISLATFTLPIEGRLLRKTKLKLTLIKPDKFLKEHNNNVWLDISVSSSP